MASGGCLDPGVLWPPAQTTEPAALEGLSGLKSPLQQAPGLAPGNAAPDPGSLPERPTTARPGSAPRSAHGSRPDPQA